MLEGTEVERCDCSVRFTVAAPLRSQSGTSVQVEGPVNSKVPMYVEVVGTLAQSRTQGLQGYQHVGRLPVLLCAWVVWPCVRGANHCTAPNHCSSKGKPGESRVRLREEADCVGKNCD
jgi:hypothetical protein